MSAWEEVVVPTEKPAERFARDFEQMRGDWQGATGTLANNLDVDGKLVYDADGRYDRWYNHRGGDQYSTESGDIKLEGDGRNSREYVDRTTHVSAVNDKESRIWDSPESAV